MRALTNQSVKTINYLPCGIGTLTSVDNSPGYGTLRISQIHERRILSGGRCPIRRTPNADSAANTDRLAVGMYRPAMAVSIPELIAVNACSR